MADDVGSDFCNDLLGQDIPRSQNRIPQTSKRSEAPLPLPSPSAKQPLTCQKSVPLIPIGTFEQHPMRCKKPILVGLRGSSPSRTKKSRSPPDGLNYLLTSCLASCIANRSKSPPRCKEQRLGFAAGAQECFVEASQPYLPCYPTDPSTELMSGLNDPRNMHMPARHLEVPSLLHMYCPPKALGPASCTSGSSTEQLDLCQLGIWQKEALAHVPVAFHGFSEGKSRDQHLLKPNSLNNSHHGEVGSIHNPILCYHKLCPMSKKEDENLPALWGKSLRFFSIHFSAPPSFGGQPVEPPWAAHCVLQLFAGNDRLINVLKGPNRSMKP